MDYDECMQFSAYYYVMYIDNIAQTKTLPEIQALALKMVGDLYLYSYLFKSHTQIYPTYSWN